MDEKNIKKQQNFNILITFWFVCLFIAVWQFRKNYKIYNQNKSTNDNEENTLTEEQLDAKIDNKINESKVDLSKQITVLSQQITADFNKLKDELSQKIEQIPSTTNTPSINEENVKQLIANYINNNIPHDKVTNKSQDNIKYSDKFSPTDKTKFPSYKDIIGMEREKKDFDSFLKYIKGIDSTYSEEKIGKLSPPRGILLYGVPGTGKTFLTRAVAKEAGENIAFYELSSSQFSCPYVGEGPRLVADLFSSVRGNMKKNPKFAASIIFLDECEEIFPDITKMQNPSSDLGNIVNQFKIELTSSQNDPKKPILVIAATNHKEKIDSAILSRLDIHIEVKVGNLKDREKYFNFLLRKRPTFSDEAKQYLLETLNKEIELYPEEKRSNRVLEQLLNKAVFVNPQVDKNAMEEAFNVIYPSDEQIEKNLLFPDERKEFINSLITRQQNIRKNLNFKVEAKEYLLNDLNLKINQYPDKKRNNLTLNKLIHHILSNHNDNNHIIDKNDCQEAFNLIYPVEDKLPEYQSSEKNIAMFSIQELKQCYSLKELTDGNYSIKELYDNGNGFTKQELKDFNVLSLQSMYDSGLFTKNELKQAILDYLHLNNLKIKDLRKPFIFKVTPSPQDLQNIGFSLKEIREAGYQDIYNYKIK